MILRSFCIPGLLVFDPVETIDIEIADVEDAGGRVDDIGLDAALRAALMMTAVRRSLSSLGRFRPRIDPIRPDLDSLEREVDVVGSQFVYLAVAHPRGCGFVQPESFRASTEDR
jgi:hypothetical protein